jgi:hypothetical protein
MLQFHGHNGDMKGPQRYIKRALFSYVLRLERGTRRVETELRLHILAFILYILIYPITCIMRGHFSIVRKMFVRHLTFLTSWYSSKESYKLYQYYKETLRFQEFLYDAA